MKIFVSYSRRDADFAQKINEYFHGSEHNVFTDVKNIQVGVVWTSAIETNISNCDVFVVIVTDPALRSSEVEKEVIQAQKENKKIIPCIYRGTRKDKIKWELEKIQGIEFTNEFQLARDLYSKIDSISNIISTTDDETRIVARPKKLSDDQWENLLDAIDRKNCIPFIGSSTLEFFYNIDNDAFITNDELAREWAEKYDYSFQNPYDLSKVSQYLAINELDNMMDVKKYVSARLRIMSLPNFLSYKFKKSPHAILAELDLPVYITTNFDFFMEAALKNRDRKPINKIFKWNKDLREIVDEETEQDPYKPTLEEPLVFHLFGNLDYPESMVLTERDHSDFIINTNNTNNKGILPTFLRRALPTSTLLFIGYSLDDINYRSIINGALSFMSTIRKRGNSIIVLKISDRLDSISNEKVTKNIGKYTNQMFELIVYWGELTEFMEELQIRWKEFNENKNEHF